MLPFSLERGLLLEDRNVFLPWGVAWEELAQLGAPNVNENFLVWHSVVCLGGLCTSVLGKLNSVKTLRDLEIQAQQAGESPDQTFVRIREHLRGIFGVPSSSADESFPHEQWQVPPITIHHMIFERFGEYHVMGIRHRGPIVKGEA